MSDNQMLTAYKRLNNAVSLWQAVYDEVKINNPDMDEDLMYDKVQHLVEEVLKILRSRAH